MAPTRLIAITALAVALVALGQQTARSQSGTFTTPPALVTKAVPTAYQPVQEKKAASNTCVVYPLSDVGHDPNLANWLAQTIPGVIQPGSWNQGGTMITCYAPAKVLVVCHNASVHAQVKAFLADMKSAMRDEKGAMHLRKPPVMRAEYTEAAPPKTPQSAGAGYPVPPPQTPPKHLFHLILRYEGDGLSDETVAGLVKQVSDAAMVKTDSDAKPKSDSAKGPSLGQLLHFIVRYEGDGIVDANVVALMKALYGANKEAGGLVAPMITGPACNPVGAYGASSTPPSTGYGTVSTPPSSWGTSPAQSAPYYNTPPAASTTGPSLQSTPMGQPSTSSIPPSTGAAALSTSTGWARSPSGISTPTGMGTTAPSQQAAPATQPGTQYSAPDGRGTAVPSKQAAPPKTGLLNHYSSDPNERMRQMLEQVRNLRELQKEWERFWMLEQAPSTSAVVQPGSAKPLPAPPVTQPGSNPAQGNSLRPTTALPEPVVR